MACVLGTVVCVRGCRGPLCCIIYERSAADYIIGIKLLASTKKDALKMSCIVQLTC